MGLRSDSLSSDRQQCRARGRTRRPGLFPLLFLCFFGCASSLPTPTYPASRFVLYTESPAGEAEAILLEAESYLSSLEETLGLKAPPVGLLRIVHFRWRRDLWSYMGKELPDFRWRRGACFETSQVYVLALSGRPGQERFQRILRHELTHFFLVSHFSDFPPWIDEGLAQVLSDGPPFPCPGGGGSGTPESTEGSSAACQELLGKQPGQSLTRSQYELARRISLCLLIRSEDSISRLLRFLEISERNRDARDIFLDAWGMSFEDACAACVAR